MSDSVDRVFSHALNTVNKIRTGSQKPPSTTRLKLYGLYKQAMEGDVDGIMEKPEGSGEDVYRAREKWDAWKQQNGLSRTEAKRRYITTLIDTMHKYASPSQDSRELVAELEFVWDQVKSNVPSSSSSSPLQTLGSLGLHMPPSYPQLGKRDRSHGEDYDNNDRPLQIRSPMSQSEEELDEDQDDDDEEEPEAEEFVDAPDSQYNPNTEPDEAEEDEDPAAAAAAYLDPSSPTPLPKSKPQSASKSKSKALIKSPSASKPTPAPPPASRAADQKWRKRVEQALVKMTAEVAALREQLESRRLFSHSRRHNVLRFLWRLFWGGVKVLAVDVLLLVILLVWMRRRGDARLEGVVRGIVGDVGERVRKVGGGVGKGVGRVGSKVPGLIGGRRGTG